MKERASRKSRENGESKTPNWTANSKSSCVYGECDGSGIIISFDGDHSYARNCRCVAYRAMQDRLKFACIPTEFKGFTIKSFDTEIYSTEKSRNEARNIKKIAIQYVVRFAEMEERGKGLYLYGETKGSGKTRLAVSIGAALITQANAGVRFVTTINLLEEIKASWRSDADGQSESKLLAAIKEIEVLILDDLGVESPTDWVNKVFYNILNDRMTASKVTIFTSNCRLEELRHDDRIINRIQKMALPVKFPDESIRADIARLENEEILRTFLEG